MGAWSAHPKEDEIHMRILSKMSIAALTVMVPVAFAACGGGGDDEEDMGGAGGSGTGATNNDGSGATNNDGSGATNNDGTGGGSGGSTGGSENQGGMGGGSGGMGGVVLSEPPFTPQDCLANPGGPADTVMSSGVGAFRDEADWMEGWTNWSVNATPEDMGSTLSPVTVTLSADITADMELDAGEVYAISGIIHVTDGATLTIPAGTLFKSTGNSTLVISRGGRIEAMGTAEAPIVFTSAAANGQKQAGDWGGIVILGNATNWSGDNVNVEGLASEPLNQHGPAGEDPIEDQDSGFMEYVRIEFGGTELQDGNEINGLTMGSVGSGTTISYVQVNTTWDDGFEWFGGSVAGDHLVVNNEGDDMFDIDQGYIGELHTLFGRQVFPAKADPNGFEWDSTEGALPAGTWHTHPIVSKVTMCGYPDGKPGYGMVLREHVEAEVSDVAFTGFDFGLDLRDAVSDELSITGSYSWGHFGGIENVAVEPGDAALADDQVETDWFADQEGNVDFQAP